MINNEMNQSPIEKFAINIFMVNGLLMRNGDRITKSIGQSSARWQVLGRANYQPQTVAQMARSMGLARQSVQRVADILAREQLITYRENKADKRAQLVTITPRGKEILKMIYEMNDQWSTRIMKQLSPTQLITVNEHLEKIGTILTEDLKDNKNYGKLMKGGKNVR